MNQLLKFKQEAIYMDCCLNELGTFYGGLSGKTKEHFGTGDAKFVTYMNVFSNCIARKDQCECVLISDDEKQNLVKKGDILFTQSSETPEEVGMASIWTHDLDVYLNSFCFGFRVLDPKKTNPLYLTYLLRSPKYRQAISIEAQGISRYNLSSSRLSSLKLRLHSCEEQQKIAEFFTALDEKIRIHEQKLTKLISTKDSILRKLFKQEIRLKDKDGSDFNPWIKVKIGDILKVKHGKDYKHLSPGKIPVMATSEAISYVDTALCTWPCALIGRKGTIDKPQFMDKPFWCIDTLFYTKALGNHSPLFQYYLFQTIDWKKFNEGTGLPSLSASTIESIQCSIPMEKEQHEIANFLRIYDEKVKICTKKIEALKQLKKAFMQRMFV